MASPLKCLRDRVIFPLNKLLKEVNKDSIRFMMLYRSNDVELEFDFKKVLKKIKIIQFFMFSIVMLE